MNDPAKRTGLTLRAVLPLLLDLGGRWRTARVLVLMVVVSLTEGFSLLLLVPLLQSAQGAAAASTTAFAGWLPAWWQPSLATLLFAFVALVTLRSLAYGWHRGESQILNARIVDGLRARAIDALLQAEWRHLGPMEQSRNRAILVSSMERVGIAVERFLAAVAVGLNVAMMAAAALLMSWRLALALALAGGAVVVAYALARRRARQLGEELNDSYFAIHHLLEEVLDALRLYKSFGREDHARGSADAAFAALRRNERTFLLLHERAKVVLQAGGAAVLAAIAWLALTRWNTPVALLVPMVALCGRALPQLQSLQESAQHFINARPAIDDAISMIRETEAHAEPSLPPGATAPNLALSLQLERISFAFPGGRRALQGIDLTLRRGETLALVGHSGAGKSTLADIIGGLLAPDSGRLLIDGVPLDAAARSAWRHRVAYVHQDAVLFAGSVRDNLLWAVPAATEAQLDAALDQASANFVHALPGGIDCPLGERGRQLSGGERQRINLARALLRRPQLLILDEATSAVDAAAERTIADAVAALKGQMTIVIIGHRGLLTDLADRRIVLEKGQLQTGD